MLWLHTCLLLNTDSSFLCFKAQLSRSGIVPLIIAFLKIMADVFILENNIF